MDNEIDISIHDLTIHDKTKELHPNLATVPFNMIMVAKSGGGKTNLIVNICRMYNKIFKNRVLVFTKSRNGTLHSLEKSIGTNIFNENDNVIERTMAFQKSQKEQGKKLKNILVILDDWITDKSLNTRRNIYDKLFSMGRHANISVIITTQQYTLLPATIRRLAWYCCLFKISNTAERKIMISEMCNCIDKNETEFEQIYNDATAEPYSFLFINAKNNKFTTRFGK